MTLQAISTGVPLTNEISHLFKQRKGVHAILFKPLQQYARNTRLILKCAECYKLTLVYIRIKLSGPNYFVQIANNLLFQDFFTGK